MGTPEKTTFKRFRTFLEERKNEIVVTFGRFNPPTTGHQKLIEKVASLAKGDKYRVYVSQTSDKKKNPLSYEDKIDFMRKMFPKHGRNIISDKSIKTIFDVMVALSSQGFTKVTLVVGSDRVNQFSTMLNQYLGVVLQNGEKYTFEDGISVVSAGERDPDADDVEGVSASKARTFAMSSDFAGFSETVPADFKDKKALYNAVRKGLGLKESANPKLHVKLPEFSSDRLKYVNNELCSIGDRIIVKECTEIHTIKKLGPNFLVVENDLTGKQSKIWISSIDKVL